MPEGDANLFWESQTSDGTHPLLQILEPFFRDFRARVVMVDDEGKTHVFKELAERIAAWRKENKGAVPESVNPFGEDTFYEINFSPLDYSYPNGLPL